MRGPTVLAALLALAAGSIAPATAGAQTGGTSDGASGPDPAFYEMPFGARDLAMGMTGTDVQTLNWSLRGLALGTPYDGSFSQPTDAAVRYLQTAAGLAANGIVDRFTRKAIAARMYRQVASWYGPTFFGRHTACGPRLRKWTVGVAHKKLPCGTRVVLAYRGRWVRTTVIDRGPYIKGRTWDLTRALARQLGTIGVGTARLKAAVAR